MSHLVGGHWKSVLVEEPIGTDVDAEGKASTSLLMLQTAAYILPEWVNPLLRIPAAPYPNFFVHLSRGKNQLSHALSKSENGASARGDDLHLELGRAENSRPAELAPFSSVLAQTSPMLKHSQHHRHKLLKGDTLAATALSLSARHQAQVMRPLHSALKLFFILLTLQAQTFRQPSEIKG
eukprot:scaffold34508_cov31-Tisochrysis_lutea.AAC.4